MNISKYKTSTSLPGPLTRCLHIMALVQLVIAWPVYDLLSRYPEFFVARHAQPGDIAFLLFSLSLLLPLVLAGLQALVFRLNPGFGGALYALIILLLFFFLGHLIANRLDPGIYVTTSAAVMALGLFLVYVLGQAGKLFVSFLSPAIVIVPLLFVQNGGIRPMLIPAQAASAQSTAVSGSSPPMLIIVFDEFPSNVLRGADGQIDARRFPNFSALSAEALWYPNATTVATSTVLAIPAILTGRYPDSYRMPHHGEYPDNLFTWLGGDYDLHVQEAVSAMCPASLCSAERLPPARRRWRAMIQDVAVVYLNLTVNQLFPDLPPINQSWEGFWGEAIQDGGMYEHRLQQMDAFLDRLQPTGKPGLDFLHVNFPHIPYEYLPSGKRYGDGWLMPGLDFATNTWVGDDWQSRQAYARFEMQVSAADAWLGRLLSKLRSADLYERSLIVITADHGVSFEPGSGRRDAPPAGNLDANILPVPLLIKLPFQTQARTDPRNAEVIDILPTIAQLLERPVPWPTDGVSLLAEPKNSVKRAVYEHEKMTPYVSSVERVEQALASAWTGQDWQAPASSLLGKSLESLALSHDPGMRVSLSHADFFQDVDPGGDFLAAHANGELTWPGHADAELALVLNGTVVAVTTAYLDEGLWRFSAMLPEAGFRAGNNVIEVLGLITGDDGHTLIRGASAGGDGGYRWDAELSTVRDSRGPLTADNGGIAGKIDYISRGGDTLEVFGWGIDAAQSRALDTVLIFAEDKLVWQGRTQMLREETHAYGVVVEVGFNAVIPSGIVHDRHGRGLRIFAISDDRRVRELQIEPD